MRQVCQGFAAALSAIVLAAATGCQGSPSPVSPGATAAVSSAAISNPVTSQGAANTGGSAAVDAELAQVRNATAAYHDVSQAEEAGYMAPPPEACVASPAGTMGYHYVNAALIAQAGVVPEKPEVLLYLPKAGGGVRLIGVEYLQPVLLRSPTGAIGPWFEATPWPAGYVVVNQHPSLFGQPFNGPMAGHEPGMPWHWDLHVWIWSPNPSGMFAQFNPSLSCEAGH
jgi:hypothetical protein